MKHFTPQLIVMGQSQDDDVLDEADRLWDEAGERYVACLAVVRPEFPAGLRHMDSNYYLHDAPIHAMGRRDHAFIIVLQLDTPPQSILTFTYDLVGEPVIDRAALPQEHCFRGQPMWQYDELELVPGTPPTWRQSILLSNGWEVKLHFRDVAVMEAEALLPTSRVQDKVTQQPVAQSA